MRGSCALLCQSEFGALSIHSFPQSFVENSNLKLNSDLPDLEEGETVTGTMYVKIKNAMTGEERMISTSKLTTISQIKEDIFKT